MMKQKIFCGRNDLDDFLLLSPCAALNQSIYNALLTLREPDLSNNRQRLRCPALDIFNEAYYQCTKLQIDKHPEEDFQTHYFEDARENLDCNASAEVVFSIVFVLLSLMENKTVKTENFAHIIAERISQSSPYFSLFASIVEDYKGTTFPLSFPIEPINVEDPTQLDWARITNNFNPAKINEAIQLADDEEGQFAILDAIEAQFRQANHCNGCSPLDAYVEALRSDIIDRFPDDAPSSSEEPTEVLSHAFISQYYDLDQAFADLSQKYREALNEIQELKKSQFTIPDLLQVAREQACNDFYQVMRVYAAGITDLSERIKAEQEIAASRDFTNLPFVSNIYLNPEKGFRINVLRIIEVMWNLGFFCKKDLKHPATKKDVLTAFGLLLHCNFSRASSDLNESRSSAKSDCQSALSIFEEMLEMAKKINGLII